MYYSREYFLNKFSTILELPLDSIIVQNLEKGMFNESVRYCKSIKSELKWSNRVFKNKYLSYGRKIVANITYTPNAPTVKSNILNELWNADIIAGMTHEELYPELHEQLKYYSMAKCIDAKPEQEHDGFFKCGKCKTKKTTYTQVQTRGADEPMTIFVTCLNCENRWKC